jgi:hypothetical protein
LAFAALALACGIAPLAQADNATKTLTGVVTDAECGKTHNMMKGMSDADCTRMCVKAGSAYALIVGDSVYTLRGHSAELNKYAGEKVTVRGSMKGKDFVIETVKPAK